MSLHDHHGRFEADDVVATVYRLEQRQMRPSEVHRLFEGYAEHGYVHSVGDAYEVPDEVAERFRASIGQDAGRDDAQKDEAVGTESDQDEPTASVSQPVDPLSRDHQADPSEPGREVEHDNIGCPVFGAGGDATNIAVRFRSGLEPVLGEGFPSVRPRVQLPPSPPNPNI